AAYASRAMLPPSLQDSLPAGWLAFAGRASTLWIAAKGFRSSILLFWTWPGAREVSFDPPSRFTSFDHLVGAREIRNPRVEVPLRPLSCMRWPSPPDRARARCVGAPRR